MTCREFREDIDDYLDDVLEEVKRDAVRAHLAGCSECRLVLQRTETLGRLLQQGLESAGARVAVTSKLSARILAADRSKPPRGSAEQRAWQWLFAHPVRVVGAGATVAAALFVTSRALAPRDDFPGFTIDVPFQTDGQTGVTHAEFPLSP